MRHPSILAFSKWRHLVRGLPVMALALGGGAASAQAVTVTPFNIFQPVFTEVYNDRIGNSRFFNGPNTDRVRVSAFVSPSPDSDVFPVTSGGVLYQSTNGALTRVSITHPAFAAGAVRDLGFVGLTSSSGGGRNEFTTSFDRAAPAVAPQLDAWDTTPFVVTVRNPGAPGATSVTFNAPDYMKSALPAFVTDLTLTGGGLNPRLDWAVPATGMAPTSASIQIRRIDAESADRSRITDAKLVHVRTLAPGTTSYTVGELFSNAGLPGFPAGLQVGARYEISVQLEVSVGGELKGRSRTFFEFKPLAAGAGEARVFLPSVGPDGKFKFDVAVSAGEKIAIDPVLAIGYDYQIGVGDPRFHSVTLPSIGDGLYDLYLFDGTGYALQNRLAAGTEYFFAGDGVDRFRVLGIEESAGVDPSDPTAFITTLTFAGSGRFTGTMTPLTITTAVPEPQTWALLLAGLGVGGLVSRRRRGTAGRPATPPFDPR